ncbi:MAG: BatD family protein, partial [Woeseiaceae bacterium]
MVKTRWPNAVAFVLGIAMLLPGVVAAAVVASIDRDEIEINESFTLKVTVDAEIDTIPDVSALEEDFQILSTSQLSNTTIINNQISRSRTWTYMLMPNRDGELTIPPIAVGSEQSLPLRVSVKPQADVLPGEA